MSQGDAMLELARLAYAGRLVDTVDEVAPAFKSSILHRTVIGAHAMEHEYGSSAQHPPRRAVADAAVPPPPTARVLGGLGITKSAVNRPET